MLSEKQYLNTPTRRHFTEQHHNFLKKFIEILQGSNHNRANPQRKVGHKIIEFFCKLMSQGRVVMSIFHQIATSHHPVFTTAIAETIQYNDVSSANRQYQSANDSTEYLTMLAVSVIILSIFSRKGKNLITPTLHNFFNSILNITWAQNIIG